MIQAIVPELLHNPQHLPALQSIHSSPRRTLTATDSGSGRLDRPDPGRLLLGVERWHTFLLSSGSEPGELTPREMTAYQPLLQGVLAVDSVRIRHIKSPS